MAEHVVYDENGVIVSQTTYPDPPKKLVSLKFKQFARLMMEAGGVTAAAWAAAKKNDDLAIWFDILREGDIDRGADFNNGCAPAFVAAGLITNQQRQDIAAAWPRE